MGRQSRRRRELHAGARQNTADAAGLLRDLEVAQAALAVVPGYTNEVLADTVASALALWSERSPVALRLDRDFTEALLDTDTAFPVDPQWLSRSPYDGYAVVLDHPLTLVGTGGRPEIYSGFLMVGSTTEYLSRIDERTAAAVVTTTGLPHADSFDALWVFRTPASARARIRLLHLGRRPGSPPPAASENIAAMIRSMHSGFGQEDAEAVGPLIALTVLIGLYLQSQEPDVTWVPPGRAAGWPRRWHGVQVGDVGWRVGAALRTHQQADVAGSPAAMPMGRTVVPHLRRAHWTRVRVVARDDSGARTGHRSGIEGVDWHYESRWIPPVHVNASEAGLPPVLRRLKRAR